MSHAALLYVSTALLPPALAAAEREVAEIVASARHFNRRNGITGYLTIVEGQFIQFLEGADDALREAMVKIRGDRRHKNIAILSADTTKARLFTGWEMGCSLDQKTIVQARRLVGLGRDTELIRAGAPALVGFLFSLSRSAELHETELRTPPPGPWFPDIEGRPEDRP